MTATLVLIVFAVTIVIMILLISKCKVHPAMSILLSVIFLGIVLTFIPGTKPFNIVNTINAGFASTIRSIALVILLGCLLGKVLEETGAAVAITKSVVRLLGPKKVIWGIAVSAAILGIPIWADSVVILLIPIVSLLAIETGASMMAYGGALYLGALVTASLVPPTPGPVAAAALLKVPLGEAVLWGLIVSIPSIIAGVFFLKTLNKFRVAPKEEYVQAAKTADLTKLPSTTKSLFPIVLPIVLIMINTFIQANFPKDSSMVKFWSFIGDPMPALLIGCLFSVVLVHGGWKERLDKKIVNNWVEDACRIAAMPVFVTGLGGSLAQFIRDADVVSAIAKAVADSGMPGILLPIIIAVIIHVITGSNTLGVMTTAALVEPMLATLGISPLTAFLCCGTGAMVLKHANSSGFWVTTAMSNMTLTQGLRTVGGSLSVAGIVGAIFTVILHYAGVI